MKKKIKKLFNVFLFIFFSFNLLIGKEITVKEIINNFMQRSYNNAYIVEFLRKNGFPYYEITRNTNLLTLKSDRIYIKNDKKIILFKVINKTNLEVDVTKELKGGVAIPKILGPFESGWYIVGNYNLSDKIFKYDMPSIFDFIYNKITNSNLIELVPYFAPGIKIIKYEGYKPVIYNTELFKIWGINKGFIKVYTRVDRTIDDSVNRAGMFISGFIKLTKNFYTPISIYFVVQHGKISKILIVNKILTFQEFKTFIYDSTNFSLKNNIEVQE